MRIFLFIALGLFAITLGAQQEVEINSEGIVVPRTDTGGEVEGTIRYNSTTKEFQGYDGTSWIRLNSESKNRRLVLSGINFTSSADAGIIHTVSHSYLTGLYSQIFSSFELPIGAEITAVRAALYDAEGNKELRLKLQRQKSELNNTTGILIAELQTTGNTTSYQDLLDDTISSINGANIAQENDVYLISVGAVEASDIFHNSPWSSSNLRIAQVVVEYKVD